MNILKFIPKDVFVERRFLVTSICKSESLDASKPRSLAAPRCLGGNREAKSIRFCTSKNSILSNMSLIMSTRTKSEHPAIASEPQALVYEQPHFGSEHPEFSTQHLLWSTPNPLRPCASRRGDAVASFKPSKPPKPPNQAPRGRVYPPPTPSQTAGAGEFFAFLECSSLS